MEKYPNRPEQNSETATGCHSITLPEHLHQELTILPARCHCSLVTRQFLLQTQAPDHPNHTSVSRPRPHGFRNIVLDLRKEASNIQDVNTSYHSLLIYAENVAKMAITSGISLTSPTIQQTSSHSYFGKIQWQRQFSFN